MDGVVAGSQAGGCDDIAARVHRTLRCAAVGQRTAQQRARLTVDKTAVTHTVVAAPSETVIGLRDRVGANSQGGGVHRQHPVHIADAVIAAAQSARNDGVAARIHRALRCAAVGQRTAQHRARLTAGQTAVGNTVIAAPGKAVIGFSGSVGGDSKCCLVNGAGGVIDIVHGVIVAAVAIVDGDPGKGDGLVGARVFVGKCKNTAGQAVAAEQCACRHAWRPARARRAIVSLDHVGGGDGQGRLVHRQRTVHIAYGVVAGSQAARSDGVAARIHRTLRRAAVNQRAAQHRARITIAQAVVTRTVAAAVGLTVVDLCGSVGGDSKSCLVDGAGGVIGIAHGIIFAAVAILDGDPGEGDGLVDARVFVGKSKDAAGQTVAAEQRACHHAWRSGRARRAIVSLDHIGGSNGQRRRIHRQRTAHIVDAIAAGRQAARSDEVAARIHRALRRAAVSQRAAQPARPIAVDKAAVGDAVIAAPCLTIVGLAGGIGGDGQGRRPHRHAARVEYLIARPRGARTAHGAGRADGGGGGGACRPSEATGVYEAAGIRARLIQDAGDAYGRRRTVGLAGAGGDGDVGQRLDPRIGIARPPIGRAPCAVTGGRSEGAEGGPFAGGQPSGRAAAGIGVVLAGGGLVPIAAGDRAAGLIADQATQRAVARDQSLGIAVADGAVALKSRQTADIHARSVSGGSINAACRVAVADIASVGAHQSSCPGISGTAAESCRDTDIGVAIADATGG